ncbi:MAG: endonuclease [Bacteroidales bacterium]|nr:endonuclease [Candidatus Cacconaster caballi]
MMKGLFFWFLSTVIMFWNVENYFDTYDDPLTEDDEFTPAGTYHWNRSLFQKKRDGIAKTIIAASDRYGELPLIVGMAEVENRYTVRQLTQHSPLSAYNYNYVHRNSPDGRGIDVALLYDADRFHILKVDSLRVKGFRTRDILYVVGVTRDKAKDTLHIFVNHWPSKRSGDESTLRRAKVARLLDSCADSILTKNPQARIIAMGDFNDDRADTTVRALFHKKARNGKGSYKYKGRWETIDHFFVSQKVNRLSRMYVFDAPFLLEEDKTYLGKKPYRTFVGPKHNGGLSDHLPIILQFVK